MSVNPASYNSSVDFRIPNKTPVINTPQDLQSCLDEIYNYAQQVIRALQPLTGVSKGPYTIATLPDVSVSIGGLATVSDGTGGKWLVYSDGTNWLYTDGSIAV